MQQAIYEQTAKEIVKSVLNGYNGTYMAYGQTGTGVCDEYIQLSIYQGNMFQIYIENIYDGWSPFR